MKKLLLMMAALSLTAPAIAEQEQQSNWYLLAGGNYTWADGYEPESLGGGGGEFGFGWAAGSGWIVNDRFNFELSFTSKRLNADNAADIDQYGVDASGLVFLNRGSMAPYLVFGIGGVDNSRVASQGLELFASLGLGFARRMGDGAGAATLRADARFIEELGNRSLNDAVFNLALQIPVGFPR